jgi:hypothetical protein
VDKSIGTLKWMRRRWRRKWRRRWEVGKGRKARETLGYILPALVDRMTTLATSKCRYVVVPELKRPGVPAQMLISRGGRAVAVRNWSGASSNWID